MQIWLKDTGFRIGKTRTGDPLCGTDRVPQSPAVVYKSFVHIYSKAYAHLGWYVGIKKSGDAKNGRLTWYPWGQKAVFFVPRRAFAEHHPLKQLVNRHGFALVILDDGTVKGEDDLVQRPGPVGGQESSFSLSSTGVREEFSKHSVLEFTPSSPVGAFRIRGVESDLYLAMDSKGRLYGEKDRQDENALFTEHSSQVVEEQKFNVFRVTKTYSCIAEFLRMLQPLQRMLVLLRWPDLGHDQDRGQSPRSRTQRCCLTSSVQVLVMLSYRPFTSSVLGWTSASDSDLNKVEQRTRLFSLHSGYPLYSVLYLVSIRGLMSEDPHTIPIEKGQNSGGDDPCQVLPKCPID